MGVKQERFTVVVGGCYSNGVFGRNWQVRQVTALEGEEVSYKILAGPNRRKRESCTRAEFVGWVGYEVRRDENSWVRAG